MNLEDAEGPWARPFVQPKCWSAINGDAPALLFQSIENGGMQGTQLAGATYVSPQESSAAQWPGASKAQAPQFCIQCKLRHKRLSSAHSVYLQADRRDSIVCIPALETG